MGFHKPFRPFRFADWRAHAASAAEFTAQTKSLDFDGSTEVLRNLTGISFGVGDDFTYATWTKRDAIIANEFEMLVGASGGGNEDRIQLSTTPASIAPAGRPRFVVFDGLGDRIKDYIWANSDWPINVWTFWVFTWTGTPSGAMLGYVNGVLTAPDTLNRDFSGNRSDASMQFMHGLGAPNVMACRRLSSAWWNTVLTASEILEMYNAGVGGAFDLRVDQGNYASSAALKHWWRFGHKISPRLAEDLGGHSALVDLEVDKIDINLADIVIDAPP